MPTTTIRQPLPVIIQHEPHQPNAADVEMQDRSAQVLRKIDAVEHQLLELAEPIVNDAKLTTLGFVRAAALSLDKPTVDTRDLFFSPFPEARTEELCDGIVNMYVEGDAEYLDYCARKHHSVSCPYYLYLRVRGLLSGAKYTRLVKWKATDRYATHLSVFNACIFTVLLWLTIDVRNCFSCAVSATRFRSTKSPTPTTDIINTLLSMLARGCPISQCGAWQKRRSCTDSLTSVALSRTARSHGEPTFFAASSFVLFNWYNIR